jgi:hypothetical protein
MSWSQKGEKEQISIMDFRLGLFNSKLFSLEANIKEQSSTIEKLNWKLNALFALIVVFVFGFYTYVSLKQLAKQKKKKR